MRVQIALVLLVLWLAALPAVGQEDTPAPAEPESAAPEPTLPTPLEAADEAARAIDYERALEHLATVAKGASHEELSRIKRRQVLYERLLGMVSLLEFARENRGSMVGVIMTREGKHFEGLIEAFELGVTSGAAIGNRRLDKGSLRLRVGEDAIRTLKGLEIAQVSVKWTPPTEGEPGGRWAIAKVRVTLHTGEALAGAPTWLLPISTLSVRAPEADEDATIVVFPGSGGGSAAESLVTELVLIGGPPVKTAAPAPETSEVTDTTASGTETPTTDEPEGAP